MDRIRPHRWPRVLFALCLGACLASAPALATSGPAGVPLVVALDFVVPPHQPGAKVRTPATIDTALAEDLARRLGRPLATVGEGAADISITTIGSEDGVPASMTVIPLGYRAAPMGIMRTDSSIARWEDLRGRTACVAAGGVHVGSMQARHGAIEMVYPTLTEALVALRIGDCDVLVHDSVLLEELLRLPEWRKFSRRLPARPRNTLAVFVPRQDKAAVDRVRKVVAQWKTEGFADTLVRKTVRDVAFEVYVEQEVPDCH